MPVFFLLIYRHSLLAYKQYLFFHTLYTILVIEFSHSKPSPTLCGWYTHLFVLATPKIQRDILHRFLEYYISMLNENTFKDRQA